MPPPIGAAPKFSSPAAQSGLALGVYVEGTDAIDAADIPRPLPLLQTYPSVAVAPSYSSCTPMRPVLPHLGNLPARWLQGQGAQTVRLSAPRSARMALINNTVPA
ncbi:hypothetical protein DFH09DRAFT_1327140 [Mycena vulgaris]|nr:hypothetical protein DFH09DRAFT_1327140 [Mycena vulgaris]